MAVSVADRTRRDAAAQGFAKPEWMALGTLAALSRGGADIPMKIGALGPLSRAIVLREVHEIYMAGELELEPADSAREPQYNGLFEYSMARCAVEYGSDELGLEYLTRSLDRARSLGAPFEIIANRTSALLHLLRASGDERGADDCAAELGRLLSRNSAPRVRIAAHWGLGQDLAKREPQRAIMHLRSARDALAEVRAGQGDGSSADIGRLVPGAGPPARLPSTRSA